MAGLRLAIDPTGMTRGGQTAETALDGVKRKAGDAEIAVNRSASKMGTSVTSFAAKAGRALGAVAAGYAGIAGVSAAVRGISQFEGSMSKLAAVSRATASEMSDMRAIAMDLGSSTEFSATQAASGLNFLAMAGFNASEGMAAIPSVLDLATAAAIDLGSAADIASNIMSGFGIEASNASDITDVLAAASSRANTTVSQLGGAMSTVAPIAAALNINLADTAAAIGVMSDAGIQGERAGTALRGVLAALAGPTKAATDALARYGLTASDVNPETRDLADIMRTLQERGLTTADAMEIFGREAASGALVLVGANDRLREFGAELRNVDGEASRMAETVRDNLGGDMNTLKSAVEGLILTIGEAGLTAVFRGATQAATALVRGFSTVIGGVSNILGRVSDFAAAQLNLSIASDNVTLAMGDEIAQANALFTLMGQGNTMTQSAALAKLSEAEAHLRNAASLRDETQAMVDQQVAALELQRITAQDALRSIAAPGTDLEQVSARQRDAYEELEQSLARIIGDQAALNALTASNNGSLSEAQAEVDRIREAIANAKDGMVEFGDGTITAIERSERLSATIGGINFSGAIQGAAFLANDLGVNLEIATKLNAALNRSAGIQSGPKPQKFSLGLPSVQTGDVGNAALRYGNLNTPPATRFEVPDLSGGGVSGLSGDAGGGGGGSAQVDRTKEAYDALMASLDPAVAASQRLAKAQETINAAMQTGNITAEDAADAYSLAQEAFDKATSSIGAGTNVWKTFQDAGANAIDRLIDGTGNLKDALIDMLKQMALAIANKRILENGGTEVSSLGGLIFNAFAGLFDAGGTIPYGQTGIVGERGPELVKSTPMGTVVTSRQDTARRLSRQQSGGMTFNIDARGAQQGVAEQIRDALKTAAPQIAQSGAAQAIQTVKTNWGTFQQQQETDGQVV